MKPKHFSTILHPQFNYLHCPSLPLKGLSVLCQVTLIDKEFMVGQISGVDCTRKGPAAVLVNTWVQNRIMILKY